MSPDQTYRDSACSGKVAFSSYAQAQRVADRHGRARRSRQVYHCIHCHQFHLGRRPATGRKVRLSTKENE